MTIKDETLHKGHNDGFRIITLGLDWNHDAFQKFVDLFEEDEIQDGEQSGGLDK